MDRPRLRPIDAYPIDHQGQKLLALHDPSGLSDGIVLAPAAVAVLQLCDGESTRDEICSEFTNRYRSPLPRETLDKLLQQLDDARLLDSDGFRNYCATIFGEFAQSPTRKSHLAGKSYPADPETLRAMLDGFFDPPRGPGRPVPNSGPLPKAIVSPHIDFNRGGAAYAWAYLPLAQASELPELIIVFGTNHGGGEQPFAFTTKNYETPFGPVETDAQLVSDLVDGVRAKFGEAATQTLFRDEHFHRGEHSLEFQMVWLKYLLGERASQVKVVPILCGTMQSLVETGDEPTTDERMTFILEFLARAAESRRTLFIAGADLAHVGPRFGDPEPLDDGDRKSLERRDHDTLQPVTRGDAAGWFAEIRREKDARRVCGLPPIYAMLQAAKPGAGKLLVYAQCPADERGGSVVSIASLVYPA